MQSGWHPLKKNPSIENFLKKKTLLRYAETRLYQKALILYALN